MDTFLAYITQEIIPEIRKKYKISTSDARTILSDLLDKDSKLQSTIAHDGTIDKIKKRKEYKAFLKKAKKEIYYHLRQYKADEIEINTLIKKIEATEDQTILAQLFLDIVQTHISTAERFEQRAHMRDFLLPYMGCQTTVLDLGCGLDPIMLFDADCKKYIAVDRDETVIAILELYKQKFHLNHLYPVKATVGDFAAVDYLDEGKNSFDLVIALKLIPVLARQERDVLAMLAAIPAKKWFISASKEALVKKQSIEKREAGVLRDFIAKTGKKIESEYVGNNEFGYIIA